MVLYDLELVARTPQVAGTPTLTTIGPIKWTNLVWSRTAGDIDTLDVDCTIDSLEAPTAARLRDMAATPNELWLNRDGVRVFAGPVTSYDVAGRSLTLHAASLAYYLAYMTRDADYAPGALDVATIVRQLVDAWQATSFGHFGLDTSGLTPTGATQNLVLMGSELKKLDQVIATLGASSAGFDLEDDPVTRRLRLFVPRKGVDRTSSVVLDVRSIGDPKLRQSVAAGVIGSDAFGTASGAGGSGFTATPTFSATLRASFGRCAVSASFSDVSEQATLDQRTARLLDDSDQAATEVNPGLLAVPGFAYGDFAEGDLITYNYDIGLGAQVLVLRVKTIAVALTTGAERFALAFF